ncbi:L,D-transpeptidase family protein [Candidatus Omnitrophota bacterium]
MRNKSIIIILAVVVVLVAVFLLAGVKRGTLCPIQVGTVTEPAAGLVRQAEEAENSGNLLEAKSIYQALSDDFPGSGRAIDWQGKAEELNMRLLFSPTVTPGSELYEIKPGDSLSKIAKKFNTTAGLIRRSNRITGDRIYPGKKIKVRTAGFTIVVDKSQNILFLKSDEEIVKTYTVATGEDNCTPVGTFKIVNKLIDPPWHKEGVSEAIPAGDPRNILGSRWMGIDRPGYGIHGTTDPGSLGRQVTDGCIRMSNSDAEELYTIVPMGTEVTVFD